MRWIGRESFLTLSRNNNVGPVLVLPAFKTVMAIRKAKLFDQFRVVHERKNNAIFKINYVPP